MTFHLSDSQNIKLTQHKQSRKMRVASEFPSSPRQLPGVDKLDAVVTKTWQQLPVICNCCPLTHEMDRNHSDNGSGGGDRSPLGSPSGDTGDPRSERCAITAGTERRAAARLPSSPARPHHHLRGLSAESASPPTGQVTTTSEASQLSPRLHRQVMSPPPPRPLS